MRTYRNTTSTILVALAALTVALLASTQPASAQFTVTRAATSADVVVPPEPVQPFVELGFSAVFAGWKEVGGIQPQPFLAVSWEEVGGIDPTPFRILIPAECFRPDGHSFQVRDFRGCGVQARLTTSGGRGVAVRLAAFSASLTAQGDVARLAMNAALATDQGTLVLGAVGGGATVVTIGDSSSMLLPNAVSVLGFNPQPEPPPTL